MSTYPIVSRSAKYRFVATVIAETCWLRHLLVEFRRPIHTTTVIYCDNVSDVYLTGNPMQHRSTKHIEIGIHFVREKEAVGVVRFYMCHRALSLLIFFTKGYILRCSRNSEPVFTSTLLHVQTAGVC
jgi:hypothetical protein